MRVKASYSQARLRPALSRDLSSSSSLRPCISLGKPLPSRHWQPSVQNHNRVPDSDGEGWTGEVWLGCWAYGNELRAEPPGKAALCFHRPQLKTNKASRSSLHLMGKTVILLKRVRGRRRFLCSRPQQEGLPSWPVLFSWATSAQGSPLHQGWMPAPSCAAVGGPKPGDAHGDAMN